MSYSNKKEARAAGVALAMKERLSSRWSVRVKDREFLNIDEPSPCYYFYLQCGGLVLEWYDGLWACFIPRIGPESMYNDATARKALRGALSKARRELRQKKDLVQLLEYSLE